MKGFILIKILVMLSFVYGILSFLTGNVYYRDAVALTFIWQVLASYFIFKYRNKGFKYLLILLAFIPLIKMQGTSFIITAISGIYAVYFSLKEQEQISYGHEVDRFKKSGIVLWIIFGLSILFFKVGVLGQASGHYIIIYLTASIILLRLLRNNDYNSGDKSVERINFIYSIILIAFTFVISISYIRNGIVKVFKIIYTSVTDLLMYIFSWFFLGIGMIMERVYNYIIYLMQKKSINGTGIDVSSGGELRLDEITRKSILEAVYENSFLNSVLRSIALVLILYIIIRFFRKTVNEHAVRQEDYEETKEFIGTVDLNIKNIIKRARQLIKPSTNYDRIRFHYRKFLKECIHNGIGVVKSDTTQDIVDKTKHKYSQKALKEIREIYIKVRYGNYNASRELLQKFLIHMKNIKNQAD